MRRRTVLFVISRLQSPSTRYRALAYFPDLREAGWEPVHLTAPRHAGQALAMLRWAAGADATVLCRRLFGPPLPRLLRMTAKHLVFDLDDAVMVKSSGRPSGTRRRRFRRTVRLCDQVWAGNDYLAGLCSRFNDAVVMLPTAVDPGKYSVASDKPRDTWDLVWIGSASTRKYLEAALPLLENLGQRIPRLRLKIIADFELPTQKLRTLPVSWSEEIEAAEIASAHVGIAPMPDDPWTRGKCGLKVLQYMAAGLPVIASDVGAHREIVIPGETGFLATSPEEWCEAASRLASDAALARGMSAGGRRRVEECYSLKTTFPKLLSALESL